MRGGAKVAVRARTWSCSIFLGSCIAGKREGGLEYLYILVMKLEIGWRSVCFRLLSVSTNFPMFTVVGLAVPG